MINEDIHGHLTAPDLEASVLQALANGAIWESETAYLIGRHLFTTPEHIALYDAIESLRQRDKGMGVDILLAELMAQGLPTAESQRLTMTLTKPLSHLHDDHDLALLSDLALRRSLQQIAAQIQMQARDLGIDVADTVEAVRTAMDTAEAKMIPTTDGLLTLTDAFGRLTERILLNQEGTRRGSVTGFPEIDRRGGLLPGHLVIVGGRTSQGKSSLATNICINAMRQGSKVAYYTLEMTAEEEAARIVASMTGIDTTRILNDPLTDTEATEVHRAKKNIDGDLMMFDERATNTAEGIIRSIRELHRHHGIKGAVVDFLQRLQYPGSVHREQATAEAVKKFKNIAKELDIWLMVLSQISRGANEGEAPTLSGLRDSGQIEEAADEVWLVHRPEVYGATARFPPPFTTEDTTGRALIRIAKGRNTGTGEFLCTFNSRTCTFSPLDVSAATQQDNEELPF